MKKESFFKVFLITLGLGLVTVSAFFVRVENFKAAPLRSIDEMVYFRMAKQVAVNPAQYNTIAYGQELAAEGRRLPEYFFLPLFKHPPLFTFLCAAVMSFFGGHMLSGAYVSAFFGVLIIPLTFFLGQLMFDWRVGLLAALWMTVDPVYMITAQKFWMDTTLAFWMVASLYLFTAAVRTEKDALFLWSGFAAGLAVNTKYPGILPVGVFLAFAFFYRRSLFKRASFWGSVFIPWLMLIPWFLWNVHIYGPQFFLEQGQIHNDAQRVATELTRPAMLACFGLLAFAAFLFFKKRPPAAPSAQSGLFLSRPGRIGLFILLALIAPEIGNSFLHVLPKTSWTSGAFMGEWPTFYFGQFVEFSPFYLFAIVALFCREASDSRRIAQWSVIIILTFFILWRNYQSRYILAVLPFLAILGSHFFLYLFQRLRALKAFFPRVALTGLLLSWLIFAVAKTAYINAVLSTPHNFCFY